MWINDTKCKYMLMFPQRNLARKGLRTKKTSKLHIIGPLCEGNPPAGSLHKRPVMWKMFSCQDIIRQWLNTLRPRQNGRHFSDDIFKWILLNENVLIPIKISLKFVPRGPINNFPTLVQVMAWHRPGDKPLSESMMVRLPTHICVTRPQWLNPQIVGNAWAHS